MLGLELDVEHRADDLDDLSDVVNRCGGCHGDFLIALVLRDWNSSRQAAATGGRNCLTLQGRRAADDLGDFLRDRAPDARGCTCGRGS